MSGAGRRHRSGMGDSNMHNQNGTSATETMKQLHFTREEALALLSLCMLAPTPPDVFAERGLMKLAHACRTFLADDERDADSLPARPAEN
jgi:hypothetical protein